MACGQDGSRGQDGNAIMKAALRDRGHVPIRLVPSRASLPYRRRSGRQPLGRQTKPRAVPALTCACNGQDGKDGPHADAQEHPA